MDALRDAVTEATALVSIMWANNETGVLFPVEEISEICRSRRVPFHCDATQAVGKIPVDITAVGIDAMSFASHKFHGPKGVGALYVRRGLRMRPLLVGGPQERGRRGGTENVAGIAGMGKAADLAAAALSAMPRTWPPCAINWSRRILSRIDSASVNGRRRCPASQYNQHRIFARLRPRRSSCC